MYNHRKKSAIYCDAQPNSLPVFQTVRKFHQLFILMDLYYSTHSTAGAIVWQVANLQTTPPHLGGNIRWVLRFVGVIEWGRWCWCLPFAYLQYRTQKTSTLLFGCLDAIRVHWILEHLSAGPLGQLHQPVTLTDWKLLIKQVVTVFIWFSIWKYLNINPPTHTHIWINTKYE